ncbi:hypothetical protein HBI56_178070 [Parastagonospora nodorum]|uniref:Uncharacterized protein n=1 Tax=Phaeosphaeria nodorum (strain SN15 / ATCC MYA-4574 / FGSC 10173) TaxID=321614 RepID=A0A7U2HUP3_PHANO|nr:hypothetical protein HBH56_047220 [Parastagonospora nodorum]QRC92550.1 hypothetical protein JI435_428380 [Parastagonospora nodorum SN15]KAH3933039.1 hypothetical protein HBH54_074960 [Parastagonospora nodorum]KAH3973173.1 hypothetical protein HBH52_147010 [Parastagonospora nodorum]KAH3980720.1 hypothetical protein HBH51_052950 [Parastagonospora nodorum]
MELLRLPLPIRQSSTRATLKLLPIHRLIQRLLHHPTKHPNIKLHKNIPSTSLNQHRNLIKRQSTSKDWEIVLRSCSAEFAHCFDKFGCWFAVEVSRKVNVSVGHAVGDSHKRLACICLSVCERLPEVCGLY